MREHCAQTGCSGTVAFFFWPFIMVIFSDKPSPKVKRVCILLKGTHNPEGLFQKFKVSGVYRHTAKKRQRDESWALLYTSTVAVLEGWPCFLSSGRIWISMKNWALVTAATSVPMMKQLLMDEVKGEAKKLTYEMNAYCPVCIMQKCRRRWERWGRVIEGIEHDYINKTLALIINNFLNSKHFLHESMGNNKGPKDHSCLQVSILKVWDRFL